MSIGQRIKERRKELNLSVDEVAKRLGKNRATIYRYESDEIENLPITVLEPLAKILQVHPSYLMGWEDSLNNIPLDLLHHYQELGMSEEEMVEEYEKFRKSEEEDLKDVDSKIDEIEILTQAAHKVGHEGDLTDEEIEKIKLAIKIALAKTRDK